MKLRMIVYQLDLLFFLSSELSNLILICHICFKYSSYNWNMGTLFVYFFNQQMLRSGFIRTRHIQFLWMDNLSHVKHSMFCQNIYHLSIQEIFFQVCSHDPVEKDDGAFVCGRPLGALDHPLQHPQPKNSTPRILYVYVQDNDSSSKNLVKSTDTSSDQSNRPPRHIPKNKIVFT